MNTAKVIKTLALGACMVFGVGVAEAGYISTQSTVEPGVWTSDYDGAMAKAEKEGIPLFVFWANPGCSHCEGLEKAMNGDEFVAWRTKSRILLVFSEGNSKVKSWIKNNARESIKSFPYAAVYWPRSGKTILEGFSAYKGKMSAYGANSHDSNVNQLITTLDFLLAEWTPGGTVDPVKPDPVKPDPVKPDPVKHQHQWGEWVATKPATCTEAGVEARNCSADDCPAPQETRTTKALGHDWTEWEITKPADVDVVGEQRRTCKRCELVETQEIPAIKPEPVREKANPAVVYGKTRKLKARVEEKGELVGTATISTAKYKSKKGTVKITCKISLFTGKSTTLSATVTPDEYADLKGTFAAKKSFGGLMDFVLQYDGGEFRFMAANDDYSIEDGEVKLGGRIEAESLILSVDFDEIEAPYGYDFIVEAPIGLEATVKGGSVLNFGLAPSIKYIRDEDGWYELIGLDDENRPNVNSVKLNYKSTTGKLTGTFKVFVSNEMNIEMGRPMLKSYSGKLSGNIIDGVGVGQATIRIGLTSYTGTFRLD